MDQGFPVVVGLAVLERLHIKAEHQSEQTPGWRECLLEDKGVEPGNLVDAAYTFGGQLQDNPAWGIALQVGRNQLFG